MQNGWWPNDRVPFEAAGQISIGEFEVNYAAARGSCASRGSMKKQRTHEKCAAARQRACYHASLVPAGDLLLRQAAVPMTTRNRAQGAVLEVVFVEVNANCQHPFENGSWRLNVVYTVFDGPRTEAGMFDAAGHCDGQILVPGDLPVRFGSFVEEDALYRAAIGPQNCFVKLRTRADRAKS
jgi:hypothetical protein